MIGPSEVLASMATGARRLATVVMFLYAAFAILMSAECFAEGLVHTGIMLGIDEFFLVQWLAPLASEAPEFIVAALFALQGRGQLGVRAMISSKVNQWTLLIGMLPLCYAISSGGIHAMTWCLTTARCRKSCSLWPRVLSPSWYWPRWTTRSPRLWPLSFYS